MFVVAVVVDVGLVAESCFNERTDVKIAGRETRS